MSTLIKGGTIVTADRTFKADILIEGESIAAIGTGLSGDTVIDATGTFVMPGGINSSHGLGIAGEATEWRDWPVKMGKRFV